MTQAVYVVDAVRTPIGKYAGTLAGIRPDDLAAHIIKGLMGRNPVFDFASLEDVILGAANQAGEDNRNVARMALLLAGLPVHIGGVTVNRLCASGLQAIADGYRALSLGEGKAIIAGGVESMTRAPFVMPKSESSFGRTPQIFDTTIGWRFTNPKLADMYYPYSMGETAENIADRMGITRDEQDGFAFASQQKAADAIQTKRFQAEIFPVSIPQKKGEPTLFDTDEQPRNTTVESLAALQPAFKKGGTVTAGNSSSVNDGASALLLVNEQTLKDQNLLPLARIVSVGVGGVDPAIMGLGPVPAARKALQRAGLSMQDIQLIELNEAFAAQSIGCIRELDLNPDIINVNGGAIALGHPLGCSGARISTTLIHEMHKRNNVNYGLATLCIGVGQGLAIIYEKC